jgi:hypothetical protein
VRTRRQKCIGLEVKEGRKDDCAMRDSRADGEDRL